MEHILKHCKGIKDQKQQILTESLLSYIRKHEKDYEKQEPEDQNIRSLKQCGLSLLDGWHVLAYTATTSGWMNDSAREGKQNICPCIEVFEAGLTASLDKLSPYHGITYRMERCDEEGIKSGWFHKNIGRTFFAPYFLSTATFDYNNSPMVWIIQTSENSNGRNI